MTSLIERLGGPDGLQSIIADSYRRVMQDEELRAFFDNVDTGRIERMQQVFLMSALSDEPADGEHGISIRQAHHGCGIQRKHFSRFVDCFLSALEATDRVRSEDIEAVINRLNMYADEVMGSTNVDG